jgi:hypothetical protein
MTVAVIGAVGLAISALANPLGIGETEVFGWLQWTGVIAGAVVTLLGIVIAAEWVPVGRRDDVAAGTQNTTIVEDRTRRAP